MHIENFKPYYEPNGPVKIKLWDENRKNKSLCINVGKTGYGKTSISDAILFCIYGENFQGDWKQWINLSYKQYQINNDENHGNISIKLFIEDDEKEYILIRKGRVNFEQNEGKLDKLTILCEGQPLKNPIEFIAEKFPSVSLMQYFIFDVDNLLTQFEKSKQKTIKDHINKFAGIESLDTLENAINITISSYKQKISNIQKKIRGDISTSILQKEQLIKNKIEFIVKEEKTIEELLKELNKYRVNPDPSLRRLMELFDEKERLESVIKNINDDFLIDNKNFDCVFLSDVIDEAVQKTNQNVISKKSLDSSLILIKKILKDKYKGLFLSEGNLKLIKNGFKIENNYLNDLNVIDTDDTDKPDFYPRLIVFSKKSKNKKERFDEIYNNFIQQDRNLIEIRYEIDQIGTGDETIKEIEIIKKVLEIRKKIEEKRHIIIETKKTIRDINSEIDILKKDLIIDEDNQKQIDYINSKIDYCNDLNKIIEKTKNEFLSDLLVHVNKKSTEMMRNILVNESYMWSKLIIDTNYNFKIIQEDGDILDLDNQANRGNLQVAMLSFFFGLTDYLNKGLPYVLDNPLIRLDVGHDKRQIESLSQNSDQLIFHLIPGREYNQQTYNSLIKFLNCQNWISRLGSLKGNVSYVEQKEPDYLITYDD